MSAPEEGPPPASLSTTRIDALTEYLEGEGVAHEVVEHDATFSASAEAAVTREPPERVAKTVVLHDGGAYLLAVIPASERLDLRKVREVLGMSRELRLATEREIAADFPAFEVGAVPPLGPMVPLAEIVDERLASLPRALCAGGDHRHAVALDMREVIRLTGARVADVCED